MNERRFKNIICAFEETRQLNKSTLKEMAVNPEYCRDVLALQLESYDRADALVDYIFEERRGGGRRTSKSYRDGTGPHGKGMGPGKGKGCGKNEGADVSDEKEEIGNALGARFYGQKYKPDNPALTKTAAINTTALYDIQNANKKKDETKRIFSTKNNMTLTKRLAGNT